MTIYELVAGLERLHRFHVPCYVQVDIATSQTTGGCVRVGTTQRLLYSAASDHHWLQLNQFHGYIYNMIQKGFYVFYSKTFNSF